MTRTPEEELESYNIFARNLKASGPSVEETVRMLHAKGVDAYNIAGTEVGPFENRYNNIDHGDVLVIKRNGDGLILEVKEITRTFIDYQTWPFPDVIVDGKYSYDRKLMKPYKYICWSHDWKAYLLIDVVKTFDKWTVDKRRDHLRRPTPEDPYPVKNYYITQKDLVTFHLHTPIGKRIVSP